MTAHYTDATVTLHHGDCLEVLASLPDASIDAVVTDPPYGLSNTDPAHVAETIVRWVNGDRDYIPSGAGFMGKPWDAFVPPVAVWDECLRVLKPGGHCLSFAGTRTVDLMTLGLRLAGFEIRDSVAWLSGSGFPKSLDVSKAIDRAAGAEREIIGPSARHSGRTSVEGSVPNLASYGSAGDFITAPATDAARTWQGWGTALKPAFEPVVVARKPLVGTVAGNVLAHGTGALNIDACRIASSDADKAAINAKHAGMDADAYHRPAGTSLNLSVNPMALKPAQAHDLGRWPANVVLDESQAAELDAQSGEVKAGGAKDCRGRVHWGGVDNTRESVRDDAYESYGDTGGASRFFYTAKAATDERVRVNGVAHPTVKPLALMRWLVRLVTPPGGVVLEPFAGSGTTVEACILEGFRCIAIEREADYLPLIVQRINRRRDPVAAVKGAGEDGGLFDLLDEEPA